MPNSEKKRIIALFFDFIIIFAVVSFLKLESMEGFLWSPAVETEGFECEHYANIPDYMLFLLITIISSFLIFKYKTTPGKILFGIKLKNTYHNNKKKDEISLILKIVKFIFLFFSSFLLYLISVLEDYYCFCVCDVYYVNLIIPIGVFLITIAMYTVSKILISSPIKKTILELITLKTSEVSNEYSLTHRKIAFSLIALAFILIFSL